jgi:hypothetical protein
MPRCRDGDPAARRWPCPRGGHPPITPAGLVRHLRHGQGVAAGGTRARLPVSIATFLPLPVVA